MKYIDILDYNSKQRIKGKKKIITKYFFNFNFFQLKAYISYYSSLKNLNHFNLKSEYDQIFQQIKSIKKKEKIDLLIVGNDFSFLDYNENFDFDLYFNQIDQQLNQLIFLKKNKNLEIIFFNFPESIIEFTHKENKYRLRKKISDFNLELFKKCEQNKIYLFDYNSLIIKFGQNNFYSKKNYYLSKSLISEGGCNCLSKEISKLISSIYLVRKKCLVLDLDNTLWGGILGEDGVYGIKISNSYEGEKFLKFQKYIKDLSKSGVILAISSKNNLSDVEECFKKNKNLILKLEDFSSIRVNWEPKYLNLNSISKELNIGKDSMVFFDDSKFEREQMKKYNPLINVIDTPIDPENYISAIDDTAYFYVNKSLTNEDLKKVDQYKILQKAKNLKQTTKNIDNYLEQLNMKLTFSSVNKLNFGRCVQMLNKTNQFNFTTRRYSESSFKKYLNNSKIISLVVKVEDKFGDHGITGLLTAKKENDTLIIENFLLSCRILGRKIENQILYQLYKISIQQKIKYVIGIYKKTKKNSQCKDFYKINKFEKKIDNKFVLNLKKNKIKNTNLFKILKK